MIRFPETPIPPQDPKLKMPAVGSAGALVAAEQTMRLGEVAALRKEIEALTARVAALESVAGNVTRSAERDVTHNAVTQSAAERQRAYRARQKAKGGG